MKEKVLLDLLADHANALNIMDDADAFDPEAWLARHPFVDMLPVESVLSLLQVAQAVKRALAPVQPSAFFKSELHQQLGHPAEAAPVALSNHRVAWAAVIGSALSVAGLLLWLVYRFRSLPEPSQPVGTTV